MSTRQWLVTYRRDTTHDIYPQTQPAQTACVDAHSSAAAATKVAESLCEPVVIVDAVELAAHTATTVRP